MWADESNAFEVQTTAELVEFITSRGLEDAVDFQHGKGGVLLHRNSKGGGDVHGRADAAEVWDSAMCAKRLGTDAFASGKVLSAGALVLHGYRYGSMGISSSCSSSSSKCGW